ncbi:DUF6850 family outer membrane beta-barrel protein [Bacteroides ihuae]|uniref:DUF6850 family outer membrane beta-barrel protein n=1 Tax=Bacteroides ihuae TaxID=1852362 RepID=UPI0008D99498|nr:DUF6850 family outer membrane beta-barrel protein [Bacteroides ihuae]
MRFRFALASYLLCLFSPAYAGDTITVQIKDQLSPVIHYIDFIEHNPATKSYLSHPEYTELETNFRRSNGKAILLQEGTQKQELGIIAKTFQSMGKGMIWGNASYRNGTKDNVKWNESADYQIVYPYVMCDTVGGNNLKSEEYAFAGGYARKLDNITWGLQVNYRALKEYRTKDPRPNNTASDLYFRGGFTYKLNTKYALGTGFFLRKYKQDNTIRFRSTIGVATVYHSTGLGSDMYLFAGKSDAYRTLYDGNGYGANLQLIPVKGYGVTIDLAYDRFMYEKQLNDLLYLPISEINENTYKAGIAYRWNKRWGARFQLSYKERTGTENRFHIPQTNVYEKIASAELYSHKVTDAKLSLLYGRGERPNGTNWYILPFVSMKQSKEQYKDPLQKMNISTLSEGLQILISSSFQKIMLHSSLSMSNNRNMKSTLILTNVPEESYVSKVLHCNYDYLSENYVSFNLSLRADYLLSGNKTLYFKTVGDYVSYSTDFYHSTLSVSAGIAF